MHYLFESKINDIGGFKSKAIEWLKDFGVFCVLDSNVQINTNNSLPYKTFDFIVAAGVHREVKPPEECLEDLDREIHKKENWFFGFLTYDLKNSFENLSSDNIDLILWPEFYFFIPQYLILLKGDKVHILSFKDDGAYIFDIIMSLNVLERKERQMIEMQPRMSKREYVEKVNSLRQHILLGDIYEVNFCQEFFTNSEIDPYELYCSLNDISPTPFSTFFKRDKKFLLSASPERFLKKDGERIISQPIKGTAPRGNTLQNDVFFKEELYTSPKERAENIMIVDLVRNDLSRIACKNSVKVDELCGIYSFSNVHQMISTVSARLKTQSFKEIIESTFPMGSMTGAPKIRAMELAEQYEITKRGIYSGAVGYVDPDFNFDFNVVIRSMQYNQELKYLNYMVGGAITWLSDAEKEYDECLVKASAIEELLKSSEI